MAKLEVSCRSYRYFPIIETSKLSFFRNGKTVSLSLDVIQPIIDFQNCYAMKNDKNVYFLEHTDIILPPLKMRSFDSRKNINIMSSIH